MTKLPPPVSALSDVERKSVEWLLPNYIPLGFLTIVAGKPGEGKSLFSMYLAARVSCADEWGFVAGRAPLGDVLLVSAEDSPEQVIAPRFDVQGGDARRVHVLRGVPTCDDDGELCLAQWALNQVAFLRRRLAELPELKLLVIDPVSSYMTGGGNVGVRRALAPLAALAEQSHIAVVLVSHLRKGGREDDEVPVLEAIIDSTAHGAYPRAGLLFSRKPDEPEKGLITLAKHNLSPPMPPLVYRVDSVDHERVERQPKLVIEGPCTELASRSAMPLTQEIRAWVREWIDQRGWIPAEFLFQLAQQHYGYSNWQIRRALKGIGARPIKLGYGRRSWTKWELPELAKQRATESEARIAVLKILFGLLRSSQQRTVTLSDLIGEVRRQGHSMPRQEIRRILVNGFYRRETEDGQAMYSPDPRNGDTLAGRSLSQRAVRDFRYHRA